MSRPRLPTEQAAAPCLCCPGSVSALTPFYTVTTDVVLHPGSPAWRRSVFPQRSAAFGSVRSTQCSGGRPPPNVV